MELLHRSFLLSLLSLYLSPTRACYFLILTHLHLTDRSPSSPPYPHITPPPRYDTVEWLARQPYCNGDVIGDGKSYLAHTQIALDLLHPPHWRGTFAYMGGFFNAWTSGVRQGGAYEARQLVWAWRKAPRKASPAGEAAMERYMVEHVDLGKWLTHTPWKPRDSFLSLFPAFESFVNDQVSNTGFSRFWQQRGLNAELFAHGSRTPILFFSVCQYICQRLWMLLLLSLFAVLFLIMLLLMLRSDGLMLAAFQSRVYYVSVLCVCSSFFTCCRDGMIYTLAQPWSSS